ncbi:Mu-like prophage major head subunit gpT [Thermosporothrix hazakensis]|jgi:hypothetical protein|uniref:Mu-like prophage major head subunit gpT n=2 Tax=Thermosporothrix TaxID=768650 RepID=A0A326U0Z2_THEHA|nr:Mu-like prophage major head subunit gpT family protein [Thermosporothrix hazakensis]PZW23558.1 Mu-like prophage major head subunit gpT [Thermosporothrix hazakensis]BBH86773.1 hypothetical protein KTC_15240 [Thermosporothrix sp. COM3]GCE51076.1 hypothetical protein KTH_59450 [Thermosporothrix hazakensis]
MKEHHTEPHDGHSHAHIIIEDARILEQRQTSPGHAVRVTVIQGGISKNGYAYDEAALRRIMELLEGAHAYADHAGPEASGRSVRDVVGFYHDVQFVPGNPARVDATLHILEAADWLWTLIREACELGRPDLIGLSVDLYGHWQHDDDLQAKKVTEVLALNSCDVVTRPSAGGTFRHIISDDSMYRQQEEWGNSMEQQPIEEQRRQLEAALQDVQQQRCELALERTLQESILPAALKTQLRSRFSGRIFEQSELEQEVSNALHLMAELSRDGLVRGNGIEKAVISDVISEAEKVQAAFDRLFDLDIDTARLGNIRPFAGIREAYARVTGDSSVASGLSSASTLGMIRVSESAPLARLTEADTTTASFAYLLGSSMNKRLLKDYQAWPADWMQFVSIVPIKDFKQQSRVRMGHFNSLPIVPENTAYSAVSLSDSAAVYVPQKRGNLVSISRETILNDDLQALRQIPARLATAAAYTLAEFVYSFLSSNPTIYDGSPLFNTGNPHHNASDKALSAEALQSGVSAMRVQTNTAGKRIGLRPRFLVVPPELEWQAMILTRSAQLPGSANNDVNPMQGYVTPIISAQLSNPAQWFLVADPRMIDTIEIGFIGGQVNPALFIQDQPTSGLNFTQDMLTYKIRHEYGGAVVDYRGLYRGA